MKTGNVQAGKQGEELAAEFLKKNNYQIIQRNYRCLLGEIDIIARDGKTLAFVEVKFRRSRSFGPPQAAIDSRKQMRISRLALHYLKEKSVPPGPARFDVVAIVQSEGGTEIELIRNAFEFSAF